MLNKNMTLAERMALANAARDEKEIDALIKDPYEGITHDIMKVVNAYAPYESDLPFVVATMFTIAHTLFDSYLDENGKNIVNQFAEELSKQFEENGEDIKHKQTNEGGNNNE